MTNEMIRVESETQVVVGSGQNAQVQTFPTENIFPDGFNGLTDREIVSTVESYLISISGEAQVATQDLQGYIVSRPVDSVTNIQNLLIMLKPVFG